MTVKSRRNEEKLTVTVTTKTELFAFALLYILSHGMVPHEYKCT